MMLKPTKEIKQREKEELSVFRSVNSRTRILK